MTTPAYIALAQDGHVTLFWGDGTEDKKQPILRGPVPANSQDLLDIIESMKDWAEKQGYTVVVPSYDLEVPDIEIDMTERDAENLDMDEVVDLINDLFDLDNNLPPDE